MVVNGFLTVCSLIFEGIMRFVNVGPSTDLLL